MNWEMITAIAQLATVFGGIPSLIYFAIQICEQTRKRRQSAVNALTVQWGDLTKALHEDGPARRLLRVKNRSGRDRPWIHTLDRFVLR